MKRSLLALALLCAAGGAAGGVVATASILAPAEHRVWELDPDDFDPTTFDCYLLVPDMEPGPDRVDEALERCDEFFGTD